LLKTIHSEKNPDNEELSNRLSIIEHFTLLSIEQKYTLAKEAGRDYSWPEPEVYPLPKGYYQRMTECIKKSRENLHDELAQIEKNIDYIDKNTKKRLARMRHAIEFSDFSDEERTCFNKLADILEEKAFDFNNIRAHNSAMLMLGLGSTHGLKFHFLNISFKPALFIQYYRELLKIERQFFTINNYELELDAQCYVSDVLLIFDEKQKLYACFKKYQNIAAQQTLNTLEKLGKRVFA